MTFESICFELRLFLNSFRSICGSFSVNTGHNPFPVSYNFVCDGFSFKHLFLGFFATDTTRFQNVSDFLFVHFKGFLFSF